MRLNKFFTSRAIFVIFLLIGLSAECLCAPSNETGQKASTGPSHSPQKVTQDVASRTSPGITVVYFPHNPNIYRAIGIGPDILIQALDKFQATGNTRPIRLETFATVVQLPSQKELILGLLDTKGIPIKSWDGDSEILVTEQSWNKAIIIDRYGTVTDGFLLGNDQHGVVQHRPTPSSFHRYKLGPSAFNKLHDLMQTLFPVEQSSLPAMISPHKP